MHVSVSPGASPGAGGVGQLTVPAVGSDTDSEVRSTLPVFVITYEYWIVSPAWIGAELPSDAFCTFCSSSDGAAACAFTVVDDGADAGEVKPVASVPVAVAVSVTLPASTSVCLTRYGVLAVHVAVAPGASPGGAGVGHATLPAVGSDMASDVSGTLPLLVTSYE